MLILDTNMLSEIMRSEVGVVFCDLPTLPAGPVGKLMLTRWRQLPS